jgi:hypothetical protein
MPAPSRQNRAVLSALAAWSLISLAILVSIAGLYAWRGPAGLELVIQTGHFSDLPITLASVAIAWLLAGSGLLLAFQHRVHRTNVFSIVGFYLVAFVYLNILRERPDYGDIQHYVRAAQSLVAGQPLPPEYVYPPLLASLLASIAPLGERTAFILVWIANVLALFAFYVLLQALLVRHGFTERLAALLGTALLLVNTPLLRTLLYGQVNLHLLNLVFLGVLFFRRAPWLSGLCMAAAVQLKASPIILLAAFVLDRHWRWLAWFALWSAVIGLALLWQHGTEPFMHFISTSAQLATERGIIFRDSSLDGLFTALGQLLNLVPITSLVLTYVSKVALVLCTTLVRFDIGRRAFDSSA